MSWGAFEPGRKPRPGSSAEAFRTLDRHSPAGYYQPMSKLPEPTCVDCQAFHQEARDAYGNVHGLCRLRPELGELRAETAYCPKYRVRGSREGQVQPVEPQQATSRSGSTGSVGRAIANLNDPVTGDTSGEITMDRDGLKQVLRELLEEETLYGYPEIGERWEDGTLVMKPTNPELQDKELPLEKFFHKIVMIRDRLRVLEAKINANDNLPAEEKVDLQAYISKCYGTLTTFNVLFKKKSDQFSSK